MLNEYSRLKHKVETLVEDISFLRHCRRINVLPKFIKIKAAVENYCSNKAVQSAEKIWLRMEVKEKYRILAEHELELYNLHLKITRGMNNCEHERWLNFTRTVHARVKGIVNKKKQTHNKKIGYLSEKKPVQSECLKPMFIPDFVVNESDE